MKDCPACGEKIKADAIRCKHCGTDLDEMKCPWCAEVIEKDAKKCKHCKSYTDKIRCSGCGKDIETDGMRCANCLEIIINEESVERLKTEKLKMNLKNWLIVILLAVIAAYLLSSVF